MKIQTFAMLTKNKITLYIFGFNHEMKSNQIDKKITKIFSTLNIMFQEGQRGIIGDEPLGRNNDPNQLFDNKDKEKLHYLQFVPSKQIEKIEDFYSEYCNSIDDKSNLSLRDLSTSSIISILSGISYKLDTVHPYIYTYYKRKNDSIIDLDDEIHIPNEEYDFTQQHQLHSFLSTIQDCLEKHDKAQDHTTQQDFRFECITKGLLQRIGKYTDNLFAEDSNMRKSLLEDRNEKWFIQIVTHLDFNNNSCNDEELNVGVSCGVAHIPGLLTLFGSHGFEVCNLGADSDIIIE